MSVLKRERGREIRETEEGELPRHMEEKLDGKMEQKR